MKNLNVRCYSGHAYAERPLSFNWLGKEQQIAKIESQWEEPAQKCFRVRTEDNKKFNLCYNEAQNMWSAAEIAPQAGEKEPEDAKRDS